MKKLAKIINVILIACLIFTSIPMFSGIAGFGDSYTASAATVVTTSEKVKVTETGLRMRASYSTSSAIMGKVTKGTVYQLKAKTSDGKWGQLSTNGYWIYLSYTEPAADNNVITTSEKVKVIETGLRMRASYSTSSAIMGKVTKGVTYQLKAKTSDGKWGQLSTNGYWIYLSYTEPVSSTVSNTTTTAPPATSAPAASTDGNIVSTTEKVKVIETGLRMRASYSTSSAIMGKVTKGTTYQLKAKTKDGKWGQLSMNGYWIYLSYTEPVKETASGTTTTTTPSASTTVSNIVSTSEYVKVTESGLRMRASYSTSSAIMGKVTKGKAYQLKAKTKDGKWGQLKSNGYWIYLSYTVPYNPTASEKVNDGGVATGVCTGQAVVDYAKQFIGNPYKYGGTSLTNGTDCSGFVQSVYAHFGISLPRTSWQQALVGKEVPYSQAKPGDIIWYPGHVAIYIGSGKIVHASTEKTGIKISNAEYRTIGSVRRIVE